MDKFVVTDKTTYLTTYWNVQNGGKTYRVECQEGDMYDMWSIEDAHGKIDTETELGQELIRVCEVYEDFDMDTNEVKLTNKYIWEHGYLLAHWPCDIGENKEVKSNASLENIVMYKEKNYGIITDWDGNVRWENEIASETEWSEEDQDDYEGFFRGDGAK